MHLQQILHLLKVLVKVILTGTNIIYINTSGTYKWDVLSGLVDLSGYQQTSTAVTHISSTAVNSGKKLSTSI